MNLFADLAKDPEIKDEERDVLGGSFTTPESGVYPATIKVAYVTTAATGAMAVNVTLTLDNGSEVRETLWVKSGTAKGNTNYYVNAKGEKKYLPGYLTVNTLCEIAAGKELSAINIEEKILNIYSFEASKEVPTKVPVLMDLLNKPIQVGLVKVIENKRQKNHTGEYVDTAETRELVEITKIFYENGYTKAELQAGEEKPAFITKWAEKWKDQVKDRRTIKDGVTPAATSGGFVPKQAATAPQAASSAPAVKSLFG